MLEQAVKDVAGFLVKHHEDSQLADQDKHLSQDDVTSLQSLAKEAD